MMDLTFQYPAWFLLLCVLLGAAYATALYFRDKALEGQSRAVVLGLAGLRFLAVTLLSALLLSPFLRSTVQDTRQPIVVFAQDVSESVGMEMDAQEKSAYQTDLEELRRALRQDYTLEEYSFGSEVREGIDTGFSQKTSNISSVLREVYDRYSNQNLGAVVLASDGIYNAGSNPVYASTRLSVPIYTVALGDTTPRRDMIIKRVFHNRIAYLGDRFTVQVDLSGRNCEGSTLPLAVYKVEGGRQRLLQRETVEVDRPDFFLTRELVLDADSSGVQRYRIALGTVENEVSTANNVKDIFVDVLDARQRILILAAAPHPDITAIRQSLATNPNYEISVEYAENFRGQALDYDFVIFHQMPAQGLSVAPFLDQLNDQATPRLFIVGSRSNLPRLNQVQTLLSITGDPRNANEVQARTAPGFFLFNLDEEVRDFLPAFPPLQAPFGEFEAAADAQVLLFQRIGKIDTRYPLLVLGEENGIKTGVLGASGIWKWRLFDYLQHDNHLIFDELFGKTMQFLSLKEDKRKFRIDLPKNIFDENEPIVFDAELYNESYQLINEPDVGLTLTNQEGNDFSYTFTRTGQAYTLNVGMLPVGNYRFRGTVVSNGEELTYDGQFSVQPIQLESYETTADHGLLRLLSDKYGGELIYPSELGTLPDRLREKGTVKPVIYETVQTRSVINLKGIFYLLVLLLSVEWFFRRYFGAY